MVKLFCGRYVSWNMADVIVIGGGPAGLTTALFAAKNGLSTTVFDTDQTWMHKAHLFNYPGIGSIDGEEFLTTLRAQALDRAPRRRGSHGREQTTAASWSRPTTTSTKPTTSCSPRGDRASPRTSAARSR